MRRRQIKQQDKKYIWRQELGLYIGEHKGEELRIGDLFERFGNKIPLELASRRWASRKLNPATIEEMPTIEEMRWEVFRGYCRSLNLSKPEISRKIKFNRDTIIVGIAKECMGCGKQFCPGSWARRKYYRKYCGYECGNKRRIKKQKTEIEVKFSILFDRKEWNFFEEENKKLGTSAIVNVEEHTKKQVNQWNKARKRVIELEQQAISIKLPNDE